MLEKVKIYKSQILKSSGIILMLYAFYVSVDWSILSGELDIGYFVWFIPASLFPTFVGIVSGILIQRGMNNEISN